MTDDQDPFEALLREVAFAPATLAWALRPGTVVNGRWRVVEEVGRGGMGLVVRAHDDVLGRDVALKLLDAAPTSQTRAALLREARAAAKVRHPSVVAIYDVDEDSTGRAFLAMEFVEGETLREHLVHHGPLPARAAWTFATTLAQALAAAHAADLVHGDLKPENAMLDASGAAKVLDFGLATSRDDDRRATAGTTRYMAPELSQGIPRSPSTDLYAFGAIVVEALAGSGAFAPPHVPTAPAALAATVRPLWALAVRCLSPDPNARPQSASDVVDLLERERASTAPSRWPAAIGGIAIAFAAIVVVGTAVTSSGPSPVRETIGAPSLQSLPALNASPQIRGRFRVGVEQWYAGDDRAAALALGDVLAARPDAIGPLLVRLCIGHFELDDTQESTLISALEAALLASPTRDDVESQIARHVIALRQSPSAAEIDEATAMVASDATPYFGRLVLALAVRHHAPQVSRAALDALRTLDPGPVRPTLHLAWGLMRDRKADAARGLVDDALRTHPTNLALLGIRGQLELGAKDYAAAQSTFDALLRRAPGTLEARFDRAEVAFLQGDLKRWRSELEHIVDGPYPPGHRGRGVALHARLLWSRGDRAGAAQIFDRGVQVLDDNRLFSAHLTLEYERLEWAVAAAAPDDVKRVAIALERLATRQDLDNTATDALRQLTQVAQAILSTSTPPQDTPLNAETLAWLHLDTARVSGLMAIARAEAGAPHLVTAAFTAPTGPARSQSVWEQGLLAQRRGEAFDLDTAIPPCLEETEFSRIWCRPVLARWAGARAAAAPQARAHWSALQRQLTPLATP